MPWTTLQAARLKLTKKRGYFDLYGFDFMIRDSRSAEADASTPNDFPRRRAHLRGDPSRRLVLIEVNTNPAMSLGNCDSLSEPKYFLVKFFDICR
jgi:D-alanine-D-alanine ligase-like ATP-grasp enzyme